MSRNDPDSSSPWYMDNRFDRYWQHYQSCFKWKHAHNQSILSYQQQNPTASSYHNSADAWKKWSEYSMQMYWYHSSQQHTPTPKEKPIYSRGSNVASKSSKQSSMKRKSKRKRNSRPTSRQSSYVDEKRQNCGGDSVPTSCGGETGDEELLCEINCSKDLVNFLAQSAKHRKQRDRAKRQAEKDNGEGEYEENLDKSYQPSSAAPKERPGQQRTMEMKMLYGKGAAMIHGMETAMQLTFDRNCDIKQPKYWPNLPLNIKFD